ncbi:MAG: DUF4149 domain-containing protein [Mariprofundaceae bacterium]
MSSLRAAGARICLALIAGLLVVTGYLAAPVLFRLAESRVEAGMLAGQMFHLSNMGVLLLSAAVAAFWMRMRRGAVIGRWRWGLLAGLVLMVSVNAFILAPMMADIKQQLGPVELAAPNDPLRARFGMLHGVGSALHLVASIAALGLVALGAPREGDGRE